MAVETGARVATYEQYIDGEWVGAESGATHDVHNPSTEEVIARVPASGREDARRAIAAARRSFEAGEWRDRPQLARSQVLFRIAEHLAEASGDWAMVEARNTGSTVRKTSMVDVPLGIQFFRVPAELALQLPWYEPLPWMDQPHVAWNFVQREPVGVCSLIVPFNFPLLIALWKLGPALAMGNSVVIKPSPHTPLSLLRAVRAIDETGLLPPGVLNVVTGPADELGEELVANPDVDKVSFTGSTATGRRIGAAAAQGIKRVTLELGGKSANVVCADADLDLAVDGTLFGIFFHQGQACESGSIALVHDDVYDDFLSRLVSRASALRVGDATDFDSQVGPVISKRQYDSVLNAVDRARQDGARVECGGVRAGGVGERGHFIAPTVLSDVRPGTHAATEEIFGPVLAVQRWSDPTEMIGRVNGSDYGLAGGIWSRDIPHAIDMARRMRTGTVWINDWHMLSPEAPFGGYRRSGVGREFGIEGLREYTEVKRIHVDQGVPRQDRHFYDVLLG
jgi:aldehyde dehydrogenase (NAD+)